MDPDDNALTGVPGLRPRSLATFSDDRGRLVASDAGDPPALSFPARRYFVVDGVPDGAVRGGHANRTQTELLSCVHGSCAVEAWWDGGHLLATLAGPTEALELGPRTWVECRDFSSDAILLVLCSGPYDPADQISDRGQVTDPSNRTSRLARLNDRAAFGRGSPLTGESG